MDAALAARHAARRSRHERTISSGNKRNPLDRGDERGSLQGILKEDVTGKRSGPCRLLNLYTPVGRGQVTSR